MKRKLGLLSILVSLYSAVHGQETNCDSLNLRIQNERDSLPRFDLFMKDRFYGLSFNSTYDKNISFGLGYYFYTDVFSPYRKFPWPSFETNLNYHLDGHLLHNLSIQIPFLISPTLNISTYTNFDKTSVFLRPGIGINAWFSHINYNFSWLESDGLGVSTKHNLSLYFRLGIPKNVWRETDDIYQSQYDRRKLKIKTNSNSAQ